MENRIPVYQDDPDTYMENICSDKVSQNGSENPSVLSGIVSPLIKWYRENKRILPWRDQNNAYYTWVSEIMLQQTRVEAVKPYFIRFITELPDPAALASCPEKKLMKLWEGLGYYHYFFAYMDVL